MAKIHVRGIKGAIVTDYEKALRIKKLRWGDPESDVRPQNHKTVIDVEGVTFEIGDVRSVELKEIDHDAQDKKEEQDMYERKMHKQYVKYRNSILAMKPEKRAERLHLFKLFYQVMTGQESYGEVEFHAKLIQQKFFEENPQRTVPDPHIFKELIGDKATDLDMHRSTGLRFVENIVRADRKWVK